MASKTNPKHKPWFPFYSAAWLGSKTVNGMTMTEAGIYINLLSMCWQYGSITWEAKHLSKALGIDRRVCVRFMDKYTDLTRTLHEGSTEVTLPKLQEWASTLAKNDVGVGQNREDKKKQDQTTDKTKRVASVSVDSVQNNDTPLPHTQGATLPNNAFDPATFRGSVGGVPAEEVGRILSYHFVHHPSPYWTDPTRGNLTSLSRLGTALPAMAAQVPAGWVPPPPAIPKPPMTRTVGDARCARCRGRGSVIKQSAEGLMVSTPCDACVPRQQVVRDGGWVDAD